jgi:hypothetical protein
MAKQTLALDIDPPQNSGTCIPARRFAGHRMGMVKPKNFGTDDRRVRHGVQPFTYPRNLDVIR